MTKWDKKQSLKAAFLVLQMNCSSGSVLKSTQSHPFQPRHPVLPSSCHPGEDLWSLYTHLSAWCLAHSHYQLLAQISSSRKKKEALLEKKQSPRKKMWPMGKRLGNLERGWEHGWKETKSLENCWLWPIGVFLVIIAFTFSAFYF